MDKMVLQKFRAEHESGNIYAMPRGVVEGADGRGSALRKLSQVLGIGGAGGFDWDGELAAQLGNLPRAEKC